MKLRWGFSVNGDHGRRKVVVLVVNTSHYARTFWEKKNSGLAPDGDGEDLRI